MSILEFLILLLIAAIAGSIGQSLAGFTRGGCLAAAVVGFMGAYIGMWMARELALPEFFVISVGGRGFPLVWSVVGSTILSLILGIIFQRNYRPARY